jgi:nitrite reductase/ring-hydroxylating ferredoxin subunit
VSDVIDQPEPTTFVGFDRRTLLMRVGVAGAGAAGVLILSACGGAQEAATRATGAAGSATDAIKNAIQTADIPVGGGKVFPELGVVVTQPEAGVFKAFSSRCTHMGKPIGSVSDGTINCPFHGSKFDIATGEVKAGPATSALPAKSMTVGSDGIAVS